MTLDFHAARENMVENQVRTNDVTDHDVQDAMRVIARESLCPPGKLHLAYAEAVVEYAPGLFLMQPRDISKLLQAVRPRAGECALAIAAPYAAAVMAEIGLKVTLRLPEGAASEAMIAAFEGKVAIQMADLSTVDDSGPYDAIVCEGAVDSAPKAWLDLLVKNGRLGVVERTGVVGRAKLYVRGPDNLIAGRPLFDAAPPFLDAFKPAAAFVF